MTASVSIRPPRSGTRTAPSSSATPTSLIPPSPDPYRQAGPTAGRMPTRDAGRRGGRVLPAQLGEFVVVDGGVRDQSVRQQEDPLPYVERQRQAAAPGAEMRLLQPHRVVLLQPHVQQLRLLQEPPAVTLPGERDRPLLGVRTAVVVVAEVTELAETVVLARQGHPVDPPGQEAFVLHQHRGMPGPGVGVLGELHGSLHHLLRYLAFVPLERPSPGSSLRMHIHGSTVAGPGP